MILSKLTVARLRVSRDIALVVLFSIISFFYGAAVTPLSMLLMVIPGALHLFGLGHSIIVSLALLTYEGRRWRFLLQGLLVTLLFLPTTAGGIPFDILSRLPIVFGSFLGDLIFSSTYGRFKNLEKLRLWVVLASVTFFFMDLIFRIPIWSLLYSPEVMAAFINGLLLMLPVIIVEWTIGGLIGYKIYQRVRKLG